MTSTVYFFAKQDCGKCEWLKKKCDLQKLGVQVMDVKTVEGLALLAWFELVRVAEISLPMLLVTDEHDKEIERITGAVKIKRYLESVR